MLRLIFVAILAVAFVAAKNDTKPDDPIWPNTFQQTFNETFYYPVIGTHYTTGTYYYDYTNLRYRVDRANGRFDRYCGWNGVRAIQNTPCSHLVLNGTRWLIYPEKKDCCRCCDAAHGCGVLKPTWLEGASFEGVQANGNYKWNQPGLQANYYTETPERVMVQINQVPNDIQDFDPASLKTSVPDEVFKLPDYCVNQKCSFFSTCRAVGLSD